MTDMRTSLNILSVVSLFVVSAGFFLDRGCFNDEPCHYNGKCTYKGLNYACACDQEWEGEFCDISKTTTQLPSSTTPAPYTGKTTTQLPSSTIHPPFTGPCLDYPECSNAVNCQDRRFAFLCPVTCKLCVAPASTVSVSSSTDSMTGLVTTARTVQTFTGNCIENENCASNPDDICNNDLTAKICPVTCKLCSLVSTTQSVHTFTGLVSTTQSVHTFTGECVENDFCDSYSEDLCHSNIATICPVKCNLCVADPCKDGPGCNAELVQEICTDSSLAPLCPLSCGICSITSPASTRLTTSPTPSVSDASTTPFAIPTKTSMSVSTTSSALVFTPSPTDISTTPKQHNTNANAVTCQTCDGPSGFCEQLHKATRCEPPYNYCINHVINRSDGSRTVNRTCGNLDTCYRDWFEGSSDSDRCQTFDGGIRTLSFECTFCCVTDNCNDQLHPPTNTLYTDYGY